MSGEVKLDDGKQLKTPYEGLVPKMSQQEFNGLEASILEIGQRDAVEVDEQDNVLDGHHRLAVLNKHGMPVVIKVVTGLSSDLEKRVYVISKALNRRNLTAESTKELRESQKKLYGQLREKDPQKWTLERIAKLCGVDRSLVGRWFRNGTGPVTKQDGRRRVTSEIEEQIVRELKTSTGGEVAKKHGVSKATISRIRNRDSQQAEKKQAFEDSEMEELIEEGISHLESAKDAFYGLDDDVLVAALKQVFGEWAEIACLQERWSGAA
jgi:ParB-like chromosome segregation protein Spo0J